MLTKLSEVAQNTYKIEKKNLKSSEKQDEENNDREIGKRKPLIHKTIKMH